MPLRLIGEPDDPRLWVQIAHGLIQDINDGIITPGEPLPSKNELADRYGSSLGPPQRAFQELAERGLIYRVPGLGYYLDTRKQHSPPLTSFVPRSPNSVNSVIPDP